MGEAPVGEKHAPETNLPLAQQNIGIIQMLKDKTKGNLTDEEKKLIDQVLSDLQLRFVNLSSKKS
jgi:hypothetical protein